MKTIKFKPIIFLLFLCIVFFYKIFANSDHTLYPALDNIYSSSQEKSLFSYSVYTHRDLPLWNPYVFSGSPFVGNPTSAMFYPLNILFLLFQANLSFSYMFALDVFLIGLFTYVYCRAIKMDKFGSLISAITIMFSGPLITMVFPGHLQNFNTFIWFPLALLFAELMIIKKSLTFSMLLGITIAFMLIAGIIQIAIYEIISLIIYFTLRSAFEIKSLPTAIKLAFLLGISFLTGVSIAAIQLMPGIEFSSLSERGDGLSYIFASDFSVNPRQVISSIFPYFFGSPINSTYWGKGNFWESTLYVGILPLFFAISSIILRRNRYVLIFSIIGIVALIYSFGKYGPIFPFLYGHIPGFDHFRVAGRFRYVYVFSLSILAGFGINFLLYNFKNKLKHLFLKFSVTIPAIILTFIIFLLFLAPSKFNVSVYEKYVLRNSFAMGINHTTLYNQTKADIIVFLTIILALYLAIVLKTKKIIGLNQLKVFIVFVCILDLWLFGSRFIATKNIKEIYKPTPIINRLISNGPIYRVFDMGGDYIPLLGEYKIESITGVHPLYLKDYRDFIWSIGKHANTPYESSFQINEIFHPIFLNLLNVKYVISNNKISLHGFSEVLNSNSTVTYGIQPNLTRYLYENSNSLPRAYIVPNAVVVPDKKKILNLLSNNGFNSKKYILLEKKSLNIQLENNSSFEEINVDRSSFNKIHLSVKMKGSGFLVLSEIAYPGWKAFINKKEVEILKANNILRSIYLTSGLHNVDFIYDPDSYTVGKYISLTALSAISMFFIIKGLIAFVNRN
ncbi:hypothetical protein HY357_03425 [Candidatus Roizmanbacteria bacterium]|nr:hypothetical protein [Candidatus Roizmanbacteria bacterium]